MRNILKAAAVAVILSGLLIPLSNKTIAATVDGTLGTTSQGTMDIDIIIPAVFWVRNLNTLAFGTWDASGDESVDDAFCVYSNGAGGYDITFTDNTSTVNGAGSFDVEDTTGPTLAIDYTLLYNNAITVGVIPVTHGTAITTTGANVTNNDCAGGIGETSNIQATFLEADLQAATAETYQAILTILVEA